MYVKAFVLYCCFLVIGENVADVINFSILDVGMV